MLRFADLLISKLPEEARLLERLSRRGCLAVACACAERQMPAYEAFCHRSGTGEPARARRFLERLWSIARSSQATVRAIPGSMDAELERLQPRAVGSRNPGARLWHYASNLALSLGDACDILTEKDPVGTTLVVLAHGRDSPYQYVHRAARSSRGWRTPLSVESATELGEIVQRSELHRREVERQLADIRLLLKEPRSTSTVKRRARRDARLLIPLD